MACRKLKDKLKKERSKVQTDPGSLNVPKRFEYKWSIQTCYRNTCFLLTALEQPRRASDLLTPAKRLALAYVCVTFWGTLRTSLPGRVITPRLIQSSHVMSLMTFVNPFRFKNLVHQYQSMYPSLTVDVEDQLKKLKVDTIIFKWWFIVTVPNITTYFLCRNTVRDCGRWLEMGSITCMKLFMVLQRKFWLRVPMPLSLILTLVRLSADEFILFYFTSTFVWMGKSTVPL